MLSILILFVIFSSLTQGFDTAPHFDLTRSVLHEHGFNDTSIKITQVENWLTDYYSNTPTTSKANRANLEKLHFDNLFTTREINNYWSWFLHNLREATKKAANDDDPLEMLTIIGIALHATQDFYSHSNWVETHPRASESVFESATFLSTVTSSQNLFTGKYPADRKSGFDGQALATAVQIHGDYQNGLNKDSPVRPNWAEAYIFAYCGSHELVDLLEKWAEAGRPGFWKKVRQFQIKPEESKALDYDLRAVRNISMWVTGKGADGHWKGDKSGLARFFDLFTPKWMASKTSVFVKQISEGSLPGQLGQNLYTSNTPAPVPPISRLNLKKRVIVLRTTLIKETDDVGLFEPKIDPRGKADFYPLITIGRQVYTDRILQDSVEFENPWFEIHLVDENVSEVPVRISVRDEDDTDADGFYKDDVCDINQEPGKTDVDFIFRLRDGTVVGDINGVFPTSDRVFTVSGAKPDKNRALLKAYITQFSLR